MSTMLCQRCRLPLVAHKSLANIGQGQMALFSSDEAGSMDQSSATIFGNPSEDASFIVLSESIAGMNPFGKSPATHPQAQVISHEANMLERLFDYLDAKTDIDMPLCGECAESVRHGLKTSYDEVCAERDAYISFLNKIKDDPNPGSQEASELESQIKRLEKENAAALQELREAETEKTAAEQELKAAMDESFRQQENDDKVYSERNEFELEYNKQETEKHRLEAISDYQTMQLHRLQRTNVYNDVFCIGHDGHFGTINGLRLGRLKDKKVEWTEINAAWGQTLLLLATVVHKLEIPLPEYRLKPLGSMSRIEKIELNPETGEPNGRTTSLELYSSGHYSFERILNHKRLDTAMVAFLDILNKVGKFVEDKDPSLKLPYQIDGDKIGGCSIRLSMNASNETWTAACKYVLTNAKWILAYVVSH